MNPEIGPAHQEAAAAAAWQQQQARIQELEQLLAAVNARQQMINIKPKQPDTYSGEGRSRLRAHDFVSLCETYFFAVGDAAPLPRRRRPFPESTSYSTQSAATQSSPSST